MKLSDDQVKKVAKLANLKLTTHEEDKYTEQLSEVLDYIDQLNSAKIENAEPTYNVTDLSNVLAEDEIKDSLSHEETLKNAPLTKNGFFETKGVFENE